MKIKCYMFVMFDLLAMVCFAAPSGAFLCYRPAEGQNSYPWDKASWWFDTTGSGAATVNRVPTEGDHVFLYSSKNDVGVSGEPMVVTNGVAAATGKLEIGRNGQNYLIGITVENGGSMTTFGEALIGNGGSSAAGGGMLMVESGGSWTAKEDFKLGISKGTSYLNVAAGGTFAAEKGFVVGQRYGSGLVTNEGAMTAYNLSVGGLGTGLFANGGTLSVGGVLAVGTNSASSGTVVLRGGAIGITGGESGVWKLLLGSGGGRTSGRMAGWGAVTKVSGTLRMTLYGQVVADGEGTARDLDFSEVKTVGKGKDDPLNTCGTNGWYAVNKGRIVYPRAQNCKANESSHPTVGDYPSRIEPTAMNSFCYTVDTPPNEQYYNFAELYAVDRNDIPAGLPVIGNDVVAGVWRIGLSSAKGDVPKPISFNGMSITFRYDWRDMREGQNVVVYRHDGSPSGVWKRISDKTAISSVNNTVSTRSFNASAETWNVGWFAVVAEDHRGFVLSFK